MAIDFDDIKKLPPKTKALLIGLAYIAVGYLFFTLFVQDIIDQHSALSTKLTDLGQQLAEKQKVTAQRERHVREAGQAKEAFLAALMKLPNQRDIPELLAAVAGAGREAGVNFIAFEPRPPERTPPDAKPAPPRPPAGAAKPAEKFYEEIPVRLQLTGSFHNALSFFAQTARLPRIVTIEDITMTDTQDRKGRGRVLDISCTMRTYMFVDKKK
ncbi:MAG: type 4a pilus biogenesis protein PilO [Thermodesulfobacteriota bacterium]